MPGADFTGRTAVVTGGAGAVGRALAHSLLLAGSTVFLVDRDGPGLDTAIAHPGWDINRVVGVPADLSDTAAVIRVADTLAARGALHVLIHCAGVHTSGSIEEGRAADFDEQFHVNLRAPFVLTQALLPLLERGSGQVVFINSSAGLTPRAGIAQYAATKHGLRALAGSLRDEVNPRGIRVLSVYLGRTASAMQARIHDLEQRLYRPERLLQPDDVATITMAALALPHTAEVTDIHIRPMLKS